MQERENRRTRWLLSIKSRRIESGKDMVTGPRINTMHANESNPKSSSICGAKTAPWPLNPRTEHDRKLISCTTVLLLVFFKVHVVAIQYQKAALKHY